MAQHLVTKHHTQKSTKAHRVDKEQKVKAKVILILTHYYYYRIPFS